MRIVKHRQRSSNTNFKNKQQQKICSFLNTASTGGYLFVYSVWYFHTKLSLQGFLSGMVYFTYMLMISMAFGLFTGAVGFFSSFIFVCKIYEAIKVE